MLGCSDSIGGDGSTIEWKWPISSLNGAVIVLGKGRPRLVSNACEILRYISE